MSKYDVHTTAADVAAGAAGAAGLPGAGRVPENANVYCGSDKAKKTTRITTGVVVGLLVAIIGTLLAAYMPGFPDEEIWRTDLCDDPDEINQRQLDRGLMASLLLSVTFGFLNFGVDYVFDSDPSTSTVFFGLLMGSVVGFFLDNLIGSEEGLILLKEDASAGVSYAAGKISSASFLRYAVTVLLDTFVSVILFGAAFPLVAKHLLPCNAALANGLCSAVIGFVTFQAYANQTRFLWAYPDPQAPKDTLISSSTIYLATVIASVVFLSADTWAGDAAGPRGGINLPWVKLLVVGSAFLLMSILYFTDNSDQLPATNIDQSYVRSPTSGEQADWEKETAAVCEKSDSCQFSKAEGAGDRAYLRTLVYVNDPPRATDFVYDSAYAGKAILSFVVISCTVLTLHFCHSKERGWRQRSVAAALICIPFLAWIWASDPPEGLDEPTCLPESDSTVSH